jgi:hypothetical protein
MDPSEFPSQMQEVRTLVRRLLWCSTFASTFLLPWAIAIGSANALEAWLPGEIKTDYWRNASSLTFLICGALAAFMLVRLDIGRGIRALGAVVVMIGAVWFALMFQFRSNCGDESIYVGTKPGVEVVTCG